VFLRSDPEGRLAMDFSSKFVDGFSDGENWKVSMLKLNVKGDNELLPLAPVLDVLKGEILLGE
jgi:hypothetical protein